jgi:O-antigen ligase
MQYVFVVTSIVLILMAIASLAAFGIFPKERFLIGAVGTSVAFLLVCNPEIALASLLVVGTLKGNPQVANAPIDVTVLLVLIVLAGIVVKNGNDLVRLRLSLPKPFLFYIPFFGLMILSLSYTPNFSAGLEKAARFLVFSGTVIFAPFFIVKTPASLRRLFLTLVVLGLIVTVDSFSSLGGKARLVSTGGDTIQLGHDAAVAILIIWYLLLPGKSFIWRVGLYGLITALIVGVIGSGSRGPVVALVGGLLFSMFIHHKLGMRMMSLLRDSALLIIVGVAIIPIVGIPQSSYDYLGRLGDPNMHHMLGPREALMEHAWRLTMAYPLTGVGIGGYPTLFRGIGAWPHNIILEISSELGVPITLMFILFVIFVVREGLNQLRQVNRELNSLDAIVFAFLIFELIDSMNTGNIVDNRGLWLACSLPFVLKALHQQAVQAFIDLQRYGRDLRIRNQGQLSLAPLPY